MDFGVPERIFHIPSGLVNLIARTVEQAIAAQIGHFGRPPIRSARRGTHDDRGIALGARRNALDAFLLENIHIEELLRRTIELVDIA